MPTTTYLASLIAATLLTAAQFAGGHSQSTIWTFDRDTVGEIARGFKGEVGQWRVVMADGRKVLAQQAKITDKVFNVALVTGTHAKDVDLSVKLRAVAGELDRGGGLIWRAKDKHNYYIARYNPLEDNYRVYKVKAGKRTMFKNADIPQTPGWHQLRVTMRGDHIECFYDGKKYLDCNDSTFPEAGMIGLWSKADAQSYFDDLTLGERRAE
jgi:hypothetical protein